ncbi:hypothetical protein E2562_010264 [Oryza meyeriana var. granulata]|uniref:Uncharacterized protein n=1 Tax=Oryza meyeriana var. granulata TaxID=110450 RepID=A0A6G1EJT7_9ORYZ|nr:hypothetical protein E2562_010264 [Oryza meyeriana var. granulata]
MASHPKDGSASPQPGEEGVTPAAGSSSVADGSSTPMASSPPPALRIQAGAGSGQGDDIARDFGSEVGMKRPWDSVEEGRGRQVEPPPLVGATTVLIVAEVARTPDPPKMRGRDTFPVTLDPLRRAHPYRRSLAPPRPVTRARRRARRGFDVVAGRTEGARSKAACPSFPKFQMLEADNSDKL